LATLNYNFDTVVIGLLLSPMMVGLYNAAYKPVTVLLAMPTTYFIGLFPALSRTFAQDQKSFREIATRSFGLAALGAVPIGIGAFFLAASIINFLFGPAYANAATVLQILSWSAVLVILRGTFRQSLNAAGKAGLDLRCAGCAVLLNVVLNLLLIPRYGIIGAAVATLISEVLWFSLAYYCFTRQIARLKLMTLLVQPIMAACVMGLFLMLTQSWFWGARFAGGLAVYLVMLFLLGQKEVRLGVRRLRSQLPVAVGEQPTL
jgi:O-antigen/teichoic acid export membrane protein